MNYETIRVRFEDSICFVQIDRPQANNTINGQLVLECKHVMSECEESATVVVLSGSQDVFCFGADFDALAKSRAGGQGTDLKGGPAALYDVWSKLATGPYVTIAHVRGKANAGGVGFAAACDIVIADDTAQFSLSELLFGLYPACVLPFLVRRIGFQKAHYLTLMAQPVSAQQAFEWGLVDGLATPSEALLRRHLQRLRRLSKTAVGRYKNYMKGLSQPLADLKSSAVAANLQMFSDADNLAAIARYVEHGIFPWEKA